MRKTMNIYTGAIRTWWRLCSIILACLALNAGCANASNLVKPMIPTLVIEEMSAPIFRDPVYDGAADPTVIWNAEKGEWWLFYTQRRATKIKLPGVSWAYGTAVGIAVSSDAGRTWRYQGTAKLSQPDEGLNSFWAPHIAFDDKTGLYHMFVTYINGVYEDWGGERQLFHYISEDLSSWRSAPPVGTKGCIDASVFKMPTGNWKMWCKDEPGGGVTVALESRDLISWTPLDGIEIENRRHEAPVVFFWRGKYRMITDPTYTEFTGLDTFASMDGQHWTFTGSILDNPGIRPDDNEQGRHADVVVVDDRAFLFYFTHPGRTYRDGKEVDDAAEQKRIRFRRSSLQVVEIELTDDDRISCDRNRYRAFASR